MPGVVLDEDLSFNEHVDALVKKISKRIGLPKSSYLPYEERLNYYICTIKPLLMYGSSIWSLCTRYNQFNFICPRYNRELDAGRSFTINAIKAWNMLPLDIRQCPSAHSFRNVLFKNAFSRQLTMDHF